MTVYGPGITEAFEVYSSQFDDLTVERRENILDLNAINPLSEQRETWQNTTTTPTEHRLSTSSGVDETAYLRTDERGQYTAGFEAQAGIGIRIPSIPQNNEEMRWGYYTVDANGDPLNGWYYGVDADGIFVAEVRDGNPDKVYQTDWNVDKANGDGGAENNPSGFNLSLPKGNIFQIEFVYYGYGPTKMEVLTDKGKVTLHKFTHDGSTSVENTNLPLRADIDNVDTSADALDLFIGGRQFSIIGSKVSDSRPAGHYVESITVDDTKWYPVVSFKLKDGSSGIGNGNDYTHILSRFKQFSVDTDANAYRWQVRRGTTPDNPTWETPSSHADKPNETAMKVDTNSTSITDGNGDLTGVFAGGGTLTAGQKNESNITEESTSAKLTDNNIMTVVVRAVPGTSGTVSEIFAQWKENW